jgi:8-oxo-dGTP pyrophosphatase MutT (NUDIX family)
VLRAANPLPEVLLIKRRAGDAFGDSYAFPGGVVDADESKAGGFCIKDSAEEADAILRVAGGGLDYYSAAIRELFEETGILLARDTAGKWANCDAKVEKLRDQVDKGTLRWTDFLKQQCLRMANDSLHYFAHWETPYARPKRWTTRFFMTELPAGQMAVHDGIETTDSRWLSASDALSLVSAGKLEMPYPTIMNLVELAEFTSVSELINWAKGRARSGIRMIRPALLEKDGKTKIVIFGDPDFPEDELE